MKRWIHRWAVPVVLAGVLGACGEPPTATPADTVIVGGAADPLPPEARLYLRTKVAGLNAMLGRDMQLQWAREGETAAIIDGRRARMMSELASSLEQLNAAPLTGDRPALSMAANLATTAPACVVNQNASLTPCILVATSSAKLNGTGSVYTDVALPVSHTTVTTVVVDGNIFASPQTQSPGFGYGTYSHSAPISFTPINCSLNGHNLTETTTHLVNFTGDMIFAFIPNPIGVNLSGSKPSSGADACQANGLTVSVSPRTIREHNDMAYIDVGNIPDGCQLRVLTSRAIVEIVELQHPYYAAYPTGGTGSTTITASCYNGQAFGVSTLQVIAGGDEEECDDDDGDPEWETRKGSATQLNRSCSPGGGEDRECGWFQWEISFDGGDNWFPYGDPFFHCDGDDWPPAPMRKGPRSMTPDRTPTAEAPAGPSSWRVGIMAKSGVARPYVTRPAGSAMPIVVIDDKRATAADLEAVLRGVPEAHTFTGASRPTASARMLSLNPARSRKAFNRIESETGGLFTQLKSAKVQSVKGLGSGKYIEATITRPDVPRRLQR